MSQRSEALAERLEQGARALEDFASGLSEGEWQNRLPGDGRKFGVVVHHVASMYPLEIQLAQVLAGGQAIKDVTPGTRSTRSTASTPGTSMRLLWRRRWSCCGGTARRPPRPFARWETRSWTKRLRCHSTETLR